MTNLLKKLVPSVLLFSMLGGAAFAQTRVATVNLTKVFDKYWKTEQATAALRDRATEMDKSRTEMVDTWKKSKDDYQKLIEEANDQAVSAELRDKRKTAAEDKLKELRIGQDSITQYERQMNATLGEEKARMRKNILEEIKLAVGSKAKAGNYSIVIDSGAQTYIADPSGPYYTASLLYSDDQNDLTDAVIAQLNAGAPLQTPAANAKPAEPKGDKK